MRLPATETTIALLLFLASGLCALPAFASDLIVSREIYADPSGNATLDEVLSAPFRPMGAAVAKGYSRDAQWIRLGVRAPANSEHVELRIRSTFLDEIRLYEPSFDQPGNWNSRVTGDRYPFEDRDRKAITLGFVVRPLAPLSTYYLRLKTSSSVLFDVEALTPDEAFIKELKLILLQVVLLGTSLWLLLWAIQDFFNHRQPVTGWFVLYQISFIFYELGFMGFLAPFVPSASPELNDLLTSLFIINMVFISFPLYRAILRPFRPNPWLFKLLTLTGLVHPSLSVAVLLGYAYPALKINLILVVFLSVFILILALTATRESPPGRRVLRALFGLQIVVLLITMVPLLGWGGLADWALNSLMAHNLIADVIIFWILFLHSRQMTAEGQQARLELGLAQQQLSLERSQKDNQQRFMAMLTHELRTPMSVVRLAIGSMQSPPRTRRLADHALLEMDGIIERCRQLDQLEHQGLSFRPAPCHVGQLLHEVIAGCGNADRVALKMEALPVIETDRQLLRIACQNLLGNALKYSAPGTKIMVTVSAITRHGSLWISLTFTNHPGNAGLPDPERVFTKYYRSPQAYNTTGAGLGLYLVEGLVAMLGGTITYQNDSGLAKFELSLPTE